MYICILMRGCCCKFKGKGTIRNGSVKNKAKYGRSNANRESQGTDERN